MTASRIEVCIIGAGPRGLSVLERICANERTQHRSSSLKVHVVDPFRPGAGKVWRTDQSCHLLMNTVASQITVYTDDSCRIDGPIEPGPTLYEWARKLADTGSADLDDRSLAEARDLTPNAYPTRAFYGAYLAAAFQEVVARAPEHVTIQVHRVRAVAVTDAETGGGRPDGARQAVRLENGLWLDGLHAVVLAQGHVPTEPSEQEAATAELAAAHRLTYIHPGNPADQDLSGIRPGQPVLLRGLGLNFFDHMALFTVGRGGVFTRGADGQLSYRPSGLEPRLFASSRRGVPYHARGENEKGAFGRYHPKLLTGEYVAQLRERADKGDQVTFATDLWPLIAREVESVYYGALLTAHGRDAEREAFVEAYLAAEDQAAPLDAFGIATEQRWSWQRLAKPYGERKFADRDDFRAWLLDYLANDVAAAREGNLSGPLKAALDVLRDLRNEIRLAVDHGGLDGVSHRDELERWYTPLNAFLSIGPPTSRIEQMSALIQAGILDLTGPGTEIRIDPATGTFMASSPLVPGAPVHATVLIEARLHEPDLRRTGDPLLRDLVARGEAVPYRISSATGDYQTGGLAVTERPYRVLDAHARAHPRRFAYGIPTESVHWVTAAGIRPGVDSVTLGDSDAIARAVLALPATAPQPTADEEPAMTHSIRTGVIV
ncbi:FAD/NAD(P)-binding protein [Kitasatospora sp. RB6PN24]|uniref:FAD/NAD(P)-binding protein n=1 Tax=Kitasatospora humi TaxID=2893891 RepID=UPI001E341D27|nr:FAD/NAD(P)-binding protein [Kitasatospora humi]MCC9311090.1 FAD/NAD(P)-binding protein [Kitasatospora humi]